MTNARVCSIEVGNDQTIGGSAGGNGEVELGVELVPLADLGWRRRSVAESLPSCVAVDSAQEFDMGLLAPWRERKRAQSTGAVLERQLDVAHDGPPFSRTSRRDWPGGSPSPGLPDLLEEPDLLLRTDRRPRRSRGRAGGA